MKGPIVTLRGIGANVMVDGENEGRVPDPCILVGRVGKHFIIRLDDAVGTAMFAEFDEESLHKIAYLLAELVEQNPNPPVHDVWPINQ